MAKYILKRPDPDESICKIIRDADTEAPPEVPLTKKDLWILERVAIYFERSRLTSYTKMMEKPSRWFMMSIWGGIGRGIGMAIGFTILGAALFFILQKIVVLNLPVISSFFAQIIDLVDNYRSVLP